ncbi:MAG: VWA domain-containing protein [Bacteroidota bacterium]
MKELLGIDTFANPEALLMLGLVPVYLFWYFRFYTRQRLVIRLSYDPTQLKKPKVNLAFLRHLPRALQMISLIVCILAIARPQKGAEIRQQKNQGLDIMICLDVSSSMEAEDFNPNRLEAAKETARNFIQGREHDRIGLVLFASQAFHYAPLTQDFDYLGRLLDDIRPGLLSALGTDIGGAIGLAMNRLMESPNKGRIIMLLTDGANNAGDLDPIGAAKVAAHHDARIYTFGLGNEVYVRPGTTTRIKSELDEPLLQELAMMTGGGYFRATSVDQLTLSFQEVTHKEKSAAEELVYRVAVDRYPFFIKTAIFLLGLSFLLMLTFVYNPLEQ